MDWTPERIKQAKEILRSHSDYDRALKRLDVSKDAIYGAFKRRNLNPPSEYLGENLDDEVVETPNRMYTGVVAGDWHIPFHHLEAVETFLDFVEDKQPDYIVLNGDFLDCYRLSSFPSIPEEAFVQDEIDRGKHLLGNLRHRCPDADIWYLEGNHEYRLKRKKLKNLGFYGINELTIPSLLNLDEHDVKWKDHMESLDLDDLSIVHGDKTSKHSAYAAKRTLEDYGYENVIIGHNHTLGSHYKDGHLGRRRAFEGGGLFDKDQAEYKDGPVNWQNGFVVFYQNPTSGRLQVDQIEMNDDGSFIYQGEVYG